MSRGIGWLLTVLLLVLGGWWIYHRVNRGNVSSNGDVFSHTEPSDSKDQTDIDGNPPKDESTATPAPAAASVPAASPAPPAPATQQPLNQSTATPPAAPQPPTGAPLSDSITANPPNGMAFGGSGKYQWYRQGNITWRIDTHAGTACIDFATMEEWSKPIVSSHGCGKT